MLEFAVPSRPLPRAAWEAYVRAGLPLAGRAVSPGWAEVGDFLGPSIRAFWRRWPPERLRGVWEGAGIADVQARLLSLGGGIVMWGTVRVEAEAEARRPAFYALAPGGWRDYVTLLHLPYTAWHLSYVAIGAALTAAFAWEPLPPHARGLLPRGRDRRARARRAQRPAAPHENPRRRPHRARRRLDRRRRRDRGRRSADRRPLDRAPSSSPAPSSSSPTTSSSSEAASTATPGSRSPGAPFRSSPPTSPRPESSISSPPPAPSSPTSRAARSAGSRRRCGTSAAASRTWRGGIDRLGRHVRAGHRRAARPRQRGRAPAPRRGDGRAGGRRSSCCERSEPYLGFKDGTGARDRLRGRARRRRRVARGGRVRARARAPAAVVGGRPGSRWRSPAPSSPASRSPRERTTPSSCSSRSAGSSSRRSARRVSSSSRAASAASSDIERVGDAGAGPARRLPRPARRGAACRSSSGCSRASAPRRATRSGEQERAARRGAARRDRAPGRARPHRS